MPNDAYDFTETLWRYYDDHGRHDLLWRQPSDSGAYDPYRIVVSEMMLQQTQVARVIPKYEQFLQVFPTVQNLAAAPLSLVLQQWSGLGYNRRAKFLWQTAQAVVAAGGHFPSSVAGLVALPGIGKNTAGAVMAYAYNEPVVFIETNIRTVYIHHFFSDTSEVADKDILTSLESTLDREQPRQFYWALMDYGSHLKKTVGNLNRASASYSKQSAFIGSVRQIRGQVLRLLAERSYAPQELAVVIDDVRLAQVLDSLVNEKLIKRQDDGYSL